MNVDHELMFGRFLNGFMQPGGPPLWPHVDEAEFDTLQTPFVIEREQFVRMSLQVAMVDVHEHTDTALAGIADHLVQVQTALRPIRIDADPRGVRVGTAVRTVPFPVELDVLEVVLFREVDARLAADRAERDFAQHLAGLDPGGVGKLARVVEIENEIVVLQQLARAVGHHDNPPRRRQRQRSFHTAG